MEPHSRKALIVIGIIATCTFLVTLVAIYITSPNTPTVGPELVPDGPHVTIEAAAGANSLDNLAQLDDCINKSDRPCEAAMLLDGRAFLVTPGTSIYGGEIVSGVFYGDVRSGALVGKKIYLPIGAFK